jgi:hypothetical protein
MSANELLGTYLNDHLGGANAGVEMARRLHEETEGRDAEVLGRLAREIEEDLETLRHLMERIGTSQNPVKQSVGWIAEKVQRLGVSEKLTGSAHLTRLLQVESLSLGVEGKLGLWVALAEVTSSYPQLAGIDLPRLAERARDQRHRLEELRLEVARRTFRNVDAGS